MPFMKPRWGGSAAKHLEEVGTLGFIGPVARPVTTKDEKPKETHPRQSDVILCQLRKWLQGAAPRDGTVSFCSPP